MSTPRHAPHSDAITALVARSVRAYDDIAAYVLITVGTDGRPCIGTNMDVHDVHELMRYLGNAESQIEGSEEIKMPGGN